VRLRFSMSAQSTLTCPKCRRKTTETMPEDACVFFFDCPHCKAVLRPLPGDCCVFCSYGDHKCPPQVTTLERRSGPKA
jgi:hypothetical protein